MPTLREIRVAGYAYGLTLPIWKPVPMASLYDIAPQDLSVEPQERVEAFACGIRDADRIVYVPGQTIDVATLEKLTGFNRSYITAEIRAGRLESRKDREHRIEIDEYLRWYGNRGLPQIDVTLPHDMLWAGEDPAQYDRDATETAFCAQVEARLLDCGYRAAVTFDHVVGMKIEAAQQVDTDAIRAAVDRVIPEYVF